MRNSPTDIRPRRWRCIFLTWAATVLGAPLIAMAFTDEVQWAAGDFLAAVLLLGSAYAALEMSSRLLKSYRSRVIAAAIVLLALLAVWAHLAVGLWD